MKPTDIKTVMLIDDSITDRFIHSKLLNIYSIGDKVLEFPSGSDALKYFKKEKNSKEKLPDLVLLDVLMPEMDGFDFLSNLKEFYAQLPKKPLIYMLSSTDDDRDLKRARENDMVERLLRKPFSPDSLIMALSEL